VLLQKKFVTLTSVNKTTSVVGRTVTYGVVGLIVTVCLTIVELWPLTSLHLFSAVRTSQTLSTELIAIVAVDEDPTRVRLDFSDHGEVIAHTSHLFHKIPARTAPEQAEMIDAWLELANLDKDQVVSVQLERVRREMSEPTASWREVDRVITREMEMERP